MSQVVSYRRALHRIPELDHDLPKTSQFIYEQLSSYSCQLEEPSPGAISAYFFFNQKETLAFRSDMDALQVDEQNIVAYRSVHPGQMHACGHDGHMAMLLELAAYVNQLTSCAYNVLLLFQPAEETTGGAKEIVDSGILQRTHTKYVFGFHVWPKLKEGLVATKAGPLMAKSSEVSIQIKGTATHAARAEEGHDALFCAVEYLHRLYQMEKQMPKEQYHLLKFGRLESGTMRNVISANAKILGTMRCFHPEVFEKLKQALYDHADALSKQTGCTFDIHISEGYPVLVNDETLVRKCHALIPDLITLKQPSMLAEDFAFYGEAVPSVFFYLGIGDTPPLHADTFDFNDDVLQAGVNIYKQLLNI